MFQKGNSGRPKGAKGKRTLQWEALNEAIIGKQAGAFNNFMNELWGGSRKEKLIAADLYLKTLEYFKPKQARTETKLELDTSVSSIIFEDAEKSKD